MAFNFRESKSSQQQFIPTTEEAPAPSKRRGWLKLGAVGAAGLILGGLIASPSADDENIRAASAVAPATITVTADPTTTTVTSTPKAVTKTVTTTVAATVESEPSVEEPAPEPPAPAPAPVEVPAEEVPVQAGIAAVPPQPAPAAPPAYYKNCTDVWNATGGPIYQGDPGFQSKFDRDGDGVGCEKRPS